MPTIDVSITSVEGTVARQSTCIHPRSMASVEPSVHTGAQGNAARAQDLMESVPSPEENSWSQESAVSFLSQKTWYHMSPLLLLIKKIDSQTMATPLESSVYHLAGSQCLSQAVPF